MLITQLPVPLHAPDQPAKTESVEAAGVSVTVVVLVNVAVQELPQLIPDGLLLTLPVPVPFLVTVSMVLTEVVSVGRKVCDEFCKT